MPRRASTLALLAGPLLADAARIQPHRSSLVNRSTTQPGRFLTGAEGHQSFAWTNGTRTLEEAYAAAFPDGAAWAEAAFFEGKADQPDHRDALFTWVREDLLGGEGPFGEHEGKVPVPWPARVAELDDQLDHGQWATYSRRQVCFIVAKTVTGAGTEGYDNGLHRYFETAGGGGTCFPYSSDFGRAFWGLLAACAADPALEAGGQGPMIMVAKAMEPPDVAGLRDMSERTPLAAADLRVCRYDDGSEGAPPPAPLRAVEAEGCRQPEVNMTGADFMTGGIRRQATVDISASWLGGYILGNACGLGGGQDERLMVYMPEVAAMAFFLSQSPQYPQLRQPSWVLGARMLFKGLDGPARVDTQFVLDQAAPITSDLAEVAVQGTTYHISSSRPFVAFMSESQGFLGDPEDPEGTKHARRNMDPRQRDVDPASPYSFEKQVRAWYGSVALDRYAPAVRPALKALVGSMGSGPWLAGLWWGDSQLGIAAMWIGHALAANSWGGSGQLPLEYYMYSAFTENPGNQCFVHAEEACRACLERCNEEPLPPTSFWIPDYAWMQADGNSCVPTSHDCGIHGLEHVAERYGHSQANDLWRDIEAAMSNDDSGAETSVFDLLLTSPQVLDPQVRRLISPGYAGQYAGQMLFSGAARARPFFF